MRDVAQRIDYCDAATNIDNVATAVLPSLCGLIGAESIALIQPHEGAMRSDSPTAGLSTNFCGKHAFSPDVCHRILQEFGKAAGTMPVVKNSMSKEMAFFADTNLHSCILIPISKNNHTYGWLLALNKVTDHVSSTDAMAYCPSGLSECEFGTFEASLMATCAAMLASHCRNNELFREKEQILIGVIRTLINTIEARDRYTRGHSDRVALIAKSIGQELGFDARESERLYMTGLLHDIGKIGVPDEILLKTEPLTDEEFETIKEHPLVGEQILSHLEHLNFVLPGVLHHHEAVDGTGYPHQLAGDEIPIAARVLAVADSYDAMTSCRPYRDAMSTERAISIIRANTRSQWDSDVVDAFLNVVDDIDEIVGDAPDPVSSLLEASHCIDSESLVDMASAKTIHGSWSVESAD